MNETLVYGLIGVALLAVLGLGIKISFSNKGKNNKTISMKNIHAGKDFVGRDKKHK